MTDWKRNYRDSNRFYIGGAFNEEMEVGVIPGLRGEIETQADKKEGKIELNIASHGGDAHVLIQILELVEEAKRRGIKVKTIVTSHAYSCGSMLAVAGTPGERYISPYAEHLVHYGSFDGYRKTTPLQLDRDHERFKRWTATILHHYMRYAHIPDLEEKIKDDSLWIPASQAIEWGLADKYIGGALR